jgi:hypothetical protein
VERENGDGEDWHGVLRYIMGLGLGSDADADITL